MGKGITGTTREDNANLRRGGQDRSVLLRSWARAEEGGDPSFTNRPTRAESGPPPHRGCLPSNDGDHVGMEAVHGGEGRDGPARSAWLRASGSCAPHAAEAIRLPCLSDGCVKAVQGGVERCGGGGDGGGCWDGEFETSG
jgi:hypothetical protein